MYDELLFYNIKKNEWLKVTAPKAPPPRSAHQVNCSIIFQAVKLCTDAVKDFHPKYIEELNRLSDISYKKVKVSNDQEMTQSERN